MNIRNVLAFTCPKTTTIKAQYEEDSHIYTFKVPLDHTYKVGDFVVTAPMPRKDKFIPFTVARIVSLDKLSDIKINRNIEYTYVVCLVDTSYFEELTQEFEDEAADFEIQQRYELREKVRKIKATILSEHHVDMAALEVESFEVVTRHTAGP